MKYLNKLIAGAMAVVIAAGGLTACGNTQSQADSQGSLQTQSQEETSSDFKSSIMFCGSTSLYPIMSSLASSFTEENVTWNKVDSSFPDSNISIYVAPGGSGVGVSAVVDKTADFGMVARDVKDSEKEKIGANYKAYVIARDALTVSVNSQNPLIEKTDSLDTDTIKKIFSGEYTTWNQVDSSLPEEQINVYIRDLSGGAYEVFQKAIMGDAQISAAATQSASMTELATNVANDPWGIGYVGFGAYNKVNKDSQVVTALKVDGVEATEENILSGDYTVQRPVQIVSGTEITNSEQAFIDYIFSQEGYDAVVANGYIPAFTPGQVPSGE
ncbi:MAG: phosphate ABC transporter substrate-binding protein [Atopobiaceae bacterium]